MPDKKDLLQRYPRPKVPGLYYPKMKSPQEVYLKIQDTLGLDPTVNSKGFLEKISEDPAALITGPVKAGTSIIDSILQSLSNAATSVLPSDTSKQLKESPLPEDVSEATWAGALTNYLSSKINTSLTGIDPEKETFNRRAERVASGVTLGISDSLRQRSIETLLERGPAKTATETLSRFIESAARTVGKDLLPGREIQENLTGQRLVGVNTLGIPEYEDVPAEDLVANVFTGGLKFLGAATAGKHIKNAGRTILEREGIIEPRPSIKAPASVLPEQKPGYTETASALTPDERIMFLERPSVGEINAARGRIAAKKFNDETVSKNEALLAAGWTPDVLPLVEDLAAERVGTIKILTSDSVRAAVNDTIATDTFLYTSKIVLLIVSARGLKENVPFADSYSALTRISLC